MTIARGEPWGEAVARDPELPLVTDDIELHRWVNARVPTDAAEVHLEQRITIAGGDLARTCGGGRRLGDTVTRAPLDLVLVRTDQGSWWMVSHLVARRSWWRGEVVLAMNAQFLGEHDVAPRSHPNDGKVDVLRVDPAMPWRVRRQARRRARQGTHVPHPQITLTQTRATRLEFAVPLGVTIDGVSCGTTRTLELTVVPDAYMADIA